MQNYYWRQDSNLILKEMMLDFDSGYLVFVFIF